MSIKGIGIDYSNICKDYNTSYLDRDNTDPDTKKCMKKVMTWTKEFVSQLLEEFDYKLYNLSSTTPVKIDDVASKRFLFYSLEKEIVMQSYVSKVMVCLFREWGIYLSSSSMAKMKEVNLTFPAC